MAEGHGGGFVCRRNQLFGWILLAFGLGLLVGKCLDGGAVSTFVGIVIIFGGFHIMRQR